MINNQCHAGTDRTGLVAALALVGVPDEVIASDYALSDERLRADYERWLADDDPADPAERARMERLLRATPRPTCARPERVWGI